MIYLTSESPMPLASLIIRTKNEERWIGACLRSVYNQTYTNFEVIIVDNCSTDQTLRKCKEYPVKIVSIEEFLPGKAINQGILASSGEYIVCLSGHCIPTTPRWLETLLHEIGDSSVAGVYGRQEPLSYTSDLDKRDLLTVFGLDRKVQIKDSFFHNANSAFRRDIWQLYPFDEVVTNIEDRVWGRQVIAAGYTIIYEPQASVFHWHGINHNLNPERARKIVRVLEGIDGLIPKPTSEGVQDLEITAIVPLRGLSRVIQGKTLLEYTLTAIRECKLISRVYVSTDNEETRVLAMQLGACVPFLRPRHLSEDYIDTTDVVRYTLNEIESDIGPPDIVVIMEETYPFRDPRILCNMICRLVEEGLDTIIAVRRENRGILLDLDGEIRLQGQGFMPSNLKDCVAMVGLIGLGCVTHPMFIRNGNLFGNRLGVYEVSDPFASIQVRDDATTSFASQFLDEWWRSNYVS